MNQNFPDKLKLSVHSLKITLSQFLSFPGFLLLRQRRKGLLKRPFDIFTEELGARSFSLIKTVGVNRADARSMASLGASFVNGAFGRRSGRLSLDLLRKHGQGQLLLDRLDPGSFRLLFQ